MASAGKAKPGKGGFVVTVAILTLMAAIGGGLVGKMVAAKSKAGLSSNTDVATKKPVSDVADIQVRELPAVVTNLAQPEETRVRLQVAMVLPKVGIEHPDLLAAKINDDIVAFLKTLTIAELQGPSGLAALREDLNERAAVRSDGKVREIIIEALVVQ